MKTCTSRSLLAGALALLALCGTPRVASAQTTLWRVGKEDNSRAEFTATANPTSYTVPSNWNSLNTFPEWQGWSNGDWNSPRDLDCTISYNLASVPTNGAEFNFKTLNASQHVPELAVFSNGKLCGIIQMIGTRWFWQPNSDADLDRGVKFGDLYRVYIPKEFLQAGTNTLRLKKLEHPYSAASTSVMGGTNHPYLSFEYDYFKLVSLSAPASEPIHSRYINLGAQSQPDNGQFSVNANDVTYRPYALKWLGLAYSGNIERAYFWRNVAGDQPKRLEFLQMLRDLNFQVLMDHYSNTKDPSQTANTNDWTVNASGQLLPGPKAEIDTFWNQYKDLFQFYELSNEPTMNFSNESLPAHKAIADYLNSVKPGHIKIVAPGYNYGFQSSGSPSRWDLDDSYRRDLETRVQATNGHSYSDGFYARDYNSLGETLDTYKPSFPAGFTNGFPKEFITSEFGSSDGADRSFGDQALTEGKAQTFDRIVRAHLAFGSKCNLYGGNDADGVFQLFDGALANPSSWQAHLDPTDTAQTARMKIFRQYALAYSTHGSPLPFTFLNESAVLNKLAYVRAVDTSTLPSLPGSGAKSNKILLNFINFDKVSQTINVRVTMPVNGTYAGERFGSESTYNAARSTVSFTASPTIDVSVTLGARESVQYILTKPIPLRDPENPAGAVNGIDYKYYEGTWANLPDFSTLTAVKSGTLTNFSLSPKNRNDYMGFAYTGYIDAPTDGLYTFYTNSDDGSKLYIGSTEIVSNDGNHGMIEKEGAIGLKAGKHAFKVIYMQGNSDSGLEVRWAGPGLTKQLIPDNRLYRLNEVAAGLVGWWKLDSSSGTTATDSSGNNLNGTTTNISWNPSSGKIGGSAMFSGSAARITLPDGTISGVGTTQTFSCWFKSNSSGVLLGIQDTAYSTTPSNWNPILYIGSDGKLYGHIWIGNNSAAVVSPSTVNNGVWHHAALVAAGNTQTLYLDGISLGTSSGTMSFGSSIKNQLGIGYTPGWFAGNSGWMAYSGSLDDVRLYNRALTSSEVTVLAAG